LKDFVLQHHSLGFKNSLDIKSALAIKRLVSVEKPDIIHAHSSKSHGIIAIASFLGLKTPIILSRRLDFELKKSGFSNWKYNLPQIRKILCVSDEINMIVQKSVKRPERVETVYSGIDLERFTNIPSGNFLHSKFNLPKDSLLVGNTSAIADHKDYFTFVDTAKKVLAEKDREIYFFIIGDGPMQAEITTYIAEHNLSDKVLMTGFLKNIPEVLNELDIFLMTSKTEGLGTSVLDAFASKLPVVSTKGGGLKETVIHHKTGLSCEIGDSADLSSQVMKLINTPELGEKLATYAFDFVNRFSKQNTAQKTLEIYQQVLA